MPCEPLSVDVDTRNGLPGPLDTPWPFRIYEGGPAWESAINRGPDTIWGPVGMSEGPSTWELQCMGGESPSTWGPVCMREGGPSTWEPAPWEPTPWNPLGACADTGPGLWNPAGMASAWEEPHPGACVFRSCEDPLPDQAAIWSPPRPATPKVQLRRLEDTEDDDLPEGPIPPLPPSDRFPSFPALWRFLRRRGRRDGFTLIKSRSSVPLTLGGRNVWTRVDLECNRGPPRMKSKGVYPSSSFKVDCPVKLVAACKVSTDHQWEYRVVEGAHNHGPSWHITAKTIFSRVGAGWAVIENGVPRAIHGAVPEAWREILRRRRADAR